MIVLLLNSNRRREGRSNHRMKELHVLLIVIPLMACTACQRQQSERTKEQLKPNVGCEQRLAEEHSSPRARTGDGTRSPTRTRGEKPSEMILDACFFSVSKRFSGKSPCLEIASTKVSTAPGRAHDFADKQRRLRQRRHPQNQNR